MRWLQAARTAGDLGGDLTPASGSARAVAVCYSPAAAQETCGGSAPRELIPLRRSPVRCRWWWGDRRAALLAPVPIPRFGAAGGRGAPGHLSLTLSLWCPRPRCASFSPKRRG